ncbi:MAG TPA: hypothetical protein VG838_15085 [Opitutaceae bacterium]|nr:hypothetical protein [Opitutaceae bacterium]
MLRPWVFVGFAGNRKLDKPELMKARIEEALQQIVAHTQAPLAAISSAAKGADTLFIEVATARQLPWVLLLPFPAAEFFNEEDFSPDDLRRLEPLLPAAIHTHVEAPPEMNRPPDEQRDLAFADCAARTVDECDYLIAVWDGQPGKTGGTGGTVAYAREQRKPLLWIHADTGAIVSEHFPARPAHPAEPAALPGPAPATAEGGLPALRATLRHYDEVALKHGPQAQDLVTTVIFLHLGATAVGLSAPVFGIVTWVAAIPASIKLGALLYAKNLSHRQHHVKDEWLRARIIAELCRSEEGTWFLPYSEKVHQGVAMPGFRPWQRSLRLWRLLAPPAPREFPAQRDAYLRARFDDPETGQIPYFTRQLAKAEKRHGIWQAWATWGTNGAIAASVLVLVLLGLHSFWPEARLEHPLGAADRLVEQLLAWKNPVKFVALVLPLLSAAVFTWLVSSDCHRRVERNREMLSYLEVARERIRRTTTWSGLERRVAETETMLLLEVLEWHSITHFTASAH